MFYEAEDNSNDYCEICLGTEDLECMIICDLCDTNVCHYYCDNLRGIPPDDWYCHDCRVAVFSDNSS